MTKFKFNKHKIPGLLLIIFGILMFYMGILNHYYFKSFTFDYGNYCHAFWDYSHFRISPMPTYSGNFLQDHFSFTLMYFVPIYWLTNWLTQTYTLIIIQYSLVLTAAWYTYKLIKLKTENIWLTAGVILLYFTVLGRYTTFSCDANIAVFSSCFIPIFLYYFEVKKYLVALIILLLSLFSRENIPIWFIFIFIVLIIEHRKDKQAVLYSFVGIFISILYFIILFKWLIPSVESSEKHFTLFNYSALGPEPFSALKFVIHHPIDTIKLFFINHLDNPEYNGVKVEFYLVYLLSGGFVLFYRPQYLIWLFPIIAQKVLNDSFNRWGISTYYSIEFITLFPLSVFYTLSAVKSTILQKGLVIAVCIATIGTTIYKLNENHCRVPWAMAPSKEKFYDKRFYETPYHLRKVHQLLSLIPSDAKVSASDHLFPHLAQRKSIYIFPTVKDAGYIVFSVYDDYFMISHNENEISRNKYLESPEWKIIAQEFPVFLLKNISASDKKGDRHQMPVMKIDTLTCDYEKVDAKNHILLSNGQKADTVYYVSSEKSRSQSHAIKLTPKDPYSTTIKLEDIHRILYLQVRVWCYTDGEFKSNIITSCGKDITLYGNTVDSTDASGWKRIVLKFWVPQNPDVTNCHISFWNFGNGPAYFDDLEIIKKYKN